MKKNFIAPFYGWGSTVSRLQSHYKEAVYFLPVSSQTLLVLIWSTSEGYRLSRPWSHPMVLNTGLLDWESSALTTRKLRLISKIMASQTGQWNITIHILPNISRSKGHQTMKFGQLIEHNMRNIFLEKSYTKCDGEAKPRAIYQNTK